MTASIASVNPPVTVVRRTIGRLAVGQALAGANTGVIFATGAIVGDMLAPMKILATLPISIFVVGMAASTLPGGMIAKRYGRRTVFLAGTGCGVLVGLLSACGILVDSFWLYCLGTFFGGAYAAVVFSFRFAAADCVSPPQRPRALSLVMGGGVVAGVLGPQLVSLTMDVWPAYLFAATCLGQAGVAALCTIVLWGIELPDLRQTGNGAGRPLSEIARQPRFVAAVVCGAVSYLIMNGVMTSAPLAMRLCGLSQGTANLSVQWHIVAMYAPSFFTGPLIVRCGSPTVIFAGLILSAVATCVGLHGSTEWHFAVGLFLLGIGWNLGFVGASALVMECHRPEERERVQAFNDFAVFGTVAVGSFTSGGLLSAFGWTVVLMTAFVPLVLAVLVLLATIRLSHPAQDDAP